jgi:hypothetical protein
MKQRDRATLPSPIVHLLIGGMLMMISSRAYSQSSQTPEFDESTLARIVWVNSYYGPNNVGIGLAARYWIFGLGTTVFAFAGDTTQGIGIRPGIVGVSVDMYMAIDFSRWLGIYGNVGFMGRLATYKGRNSFPSDDVISVGGGFQISLASHLMLGVGYNALVTSPEVTGDPTYDPIQSVVAQVGYRL